MAFLIITVTDQQTGLPVADAAVKLRPAAGQLLAPTLASGFTNSRGEYRLRITWGFLTNHTYDILVTATGYHDAQPIVKTLFGFLNQYETVALEPDLISTTTPLTYPRLVGTNMAPELVVELPALTPAPDALIVDVKGTYPSRTSTAVPPSGRVVVPLASRLVVAPPRALTLIARSDRLRYAPELLETYIIDVSVRQGNRITPVGTLRTTALLASLTDPATTFSQSCWLSPWPGIVPVERGGYAELIAILETGENLADTGTLYLYGHEADQNSSIVSTETVGFMIPMTRAAHRAYRIRIPDITGASLVRCVLSTTQRTYPPIWLQYRTLY